MLKESDHLYIRPTVTHIPVNCKLLADRGVPLEDPTVYRTYAEKFNFLSNIRPDVSFALQTLSQFMQKHSSSHMVALDHLLRYLYGSLG